jgi:hypothetical protein
MPTRATDVAVGSDVRRWEPLHRGLGTEPFQWCCEQSGAKPCFLLQDNEIAIRNHHKMVDDFILAKASRL